MCPTPFVGLIYEPVGTHGLKVAVYGDVVGILDQYGNHHAISRDAAFELLEWLFPFRPVGPEEPTIASPERGFGQLVEHQSPERQERT